MKALRSKFSGTPSVVNHYASILRENEAFCRSNSDAREASAELRNLVNEARGSTMWESQVTPDRFARVVSCSAMGTYLSFIFRPLAFGIYLDFLVGNVISVFMQLRTLLEQLAK